jgi:hypothetical protein
LGCKILNKWGKLPKLEITKFWKLKRAVWFD